MNCPTCGYLLQQLKVSTNSGSNFEVDHCGRCGGTWFDPFEINRIPLHEVNRIAQITVLPHEPPPSFDVRKCPQCQLVLASSTSEIVPRGVELLRCSKCHGVWASQKALEMFKAGQNATIKEYKFKNLGVPSLAVAFIPAIFTLLLFFTTFATVRNLKDQKDNRTQAEQLVSSVMIDSVTANAAAVTFKTNTPLFSSISYGPSSFEQIEKMVSLKPSATHAIFLTNLNPDTTYMYTITVTSEKGEKFTTLPQGFRTGLPLGR